MPPIDSDRFRLARSPDRRRSTNLPRPKNSERFLKGPVPLAWLEIAAQLPGKSLHVGVALWFLGGLQKSRVVRLSNANGIRFGLDRNAKYRGLAWLEVAGLVTVERKLGRAPVVTINEATLSAALVRSESGV